MTSNLAIIGFGEAGSTFASAADWRDRAAGFDIDASRAQAMADAGICSARSASEALAEAEIVLSLVTADAALKVASDYARFLKPGTIWCDMNSVAPQTKRSAAEVIEVGGGRYIDVAILAPVNPARLSVPLLLSGEAAAEAADRLSVLGFAKSHIVGDQVGKASAIKMIRSVMVKGIEALTDEMMEAAEAAGVVDEVLASLDASERRDSWTDRAAYNLERMATHGARRAAEMEESAKTLAALGVQPVMTRGTVERQRSAPRRKPGLARRSAR